MCVAIRQHSYSSVHKMTLPAILNFVINGAGLENDTREPAICVSYGNNVQQKDSDLSFSHAGKAEVAESANGISTWTY